MGSRGPEEHLTKLVRGIQQYSDSRGLTSRITTVSGDAGTGQRHIELTLQNGETKSIDIQEMYWGDLRPYLSTQNIRRKVLRGLSLLWFWIKDPRIWNQANTNRFMFGNMVGALILLIAWYYSALTTAFVAVGADPGMFKTIPVFMTLAETIGDIGKTMGGWQAWVAVSLIIGLLPTNQIIDISYATMCYLENRRGIRFKIRARVGKALSLAGHAPGTYDSVTLLSHSFGTVIATEVLAGYSLTHGPTLRFITLGSPLRLLGQRSQAVQDAVKTVAGNHKVGSWMDFYSDHDWLCTRAPVDDHVTKFVGESLATTVPFDEKITGASHELYFEDRRVLEALLLTQDSIT